MGHRARMAAQGVGVVVKPDEWQAVKSVLRQVIDLPAGERAAFMDSACRDQPALRREVDSLLAAHEAELVAGDPLRDVVDASRRAEVGLFDASRDDGLRATLQEGLGSQFDVLGMLGSGGMGAVFLAEERALGRTVAIKVLRPDRAVTAGSRERFRREARIAAQLSHVGIVPLHSFGEVNGLWYIVMEYVCGPTLAQRLENESTLPIDETRRILLAIAEALDHAHRRGVVHRDIKPANILLDQATGQPRLADFGIGQFDDASDSLTVTGTFVGTPLFMSPEQTEDGGEVDGRSDLYSLGAVAYAMLTGRAPFAGLDTVDVLSRRRLDAVTPLQHVAPRVPRDMAYIVMRCLERDRTLRWRDAAALCNALKSSESVLASDLPEVIADLPGYAAYAMTWMALWVAFAFGSARSTTSRAILLLVAVLVPVGPALHVWRVRAHGMRASQLLRLVLRPPRWWGIWWPSRLRDPNDLWPLMPPIARAIRRLVAIFFALLVLIALSADAESPAVRFMHTLSTYVLVVGTPIAIAFAWRWGARHKLGFDDGVQFLFFSTTPSAFWRQPHIARLLSRATHSIRPPDALVVSDHERAADQLMAAFPTTFAGIGPTVQRAVRHHVEALAAIDREIAGLARDASPDEINRLTMRLAAIAEAKPASHDQTELEDTWRRELEILRRIQGQHTIALARRSTLMTQLHAVWPQLNTLVNAERDGEAAIGEAQRGMRALCERMLGAAESPVTSQSHHTVE